MTTNISVLLDKAKLMHKLSSDYKLALVMGIQQTTLGNYRTGKTLPDARVITKICELTGDDAALLAAEIEAARAKTDEARALWQSIARRLSIGAAAGIGAAMLSGCLWLGDAASTLTATASQLHHLCILCKVKTVDGASRIHRRVLALYRRCCATLDCFLSGVQNDQIPVSCA